MESQNRAIILLQYLNNRKAFNFASPVIHILEREKGPADVLYSVDNFSDSLTVHYAKALMDQSKNILLVCDLNKAEQPGSLLAVLNYAVKKKNTKLIVIGKSPILQPFIKFLDGKEVANVNGLQGILNRNV